MSGIQIENLVKTYGDNIAVNGLNLNLEKGEGLWIFRTKWSR